MVAGKIRPSIIINHELYRCKEHIKRERFIRTPQDSVTADGFQGQNHVLWSSYQQLISDLQRGRGHGLDQASALLSFVLIDAKLLLNIFTAKR